MKRSTLRAWMMAMGALVFVQVAHAQSTYRLQQIGPDPTPFGFYYGNDMNDKGEVVGGVYGTFTGFLWQEGKLTPIPALPGSTDGRSEAFGINNRTQVVGSSNAGGGTRPYLWQRGRIRDTGAFPNSIHVPATDLNSHGVILGSVSGVSDLLYQPFLQTRSATHVLDALPGDTLAVGYGINERGSVVGHSGTPTTTLAVIWKRRQIHQLPLLPGAVTSLAGGINNRDDVAGEVGFNDGSDSVAVIWRHDREIIELPSLFTGPFSRARAADINDRGQAVGYNSGANGSSIATLWEHGMVYDLNDLLRADDPLRPFVTLHTARVINNRGQILAVGRDSRFSFASITYRLTPSGRL